LVRSASTMALFDENVPPLDVAELTEPLGERLDK
jgi:hypothetical protein